MFKISDFSKFSRVSVKMLRHYDQLNLLPPAYVDPVSKYRYYSADQLPRLNRIIALKELGFSLEQVSHLLDSELTSEQIRGMLKLRREEIRQRLQQEEARLTRVEMRLRQIDLEVGPPPYDVILREVGPQLSASIRRQIEQKEQITQLFEELEAFVARHSARAMAAPLMIYHDQAFEEEGQDIEVVVPIQFTLPGDAPVRIYELEGSTSMACIVHVGSYESMGRALNLLLGWVQAHHYEIAGPLRELYLRFGANNAGYQLPAAYLAENRAEFVTELQLPVRKSNFGQKESGA